MKTKLKLHSAQRNELTRIFRNLLREEKFYDSWGPTLKGYYEDSIVWYFTPFKGTIEMLPPIECDVREERDEDENLINVVYKFKMELNFNGIKDLKRSILLEREINKGSLDSVV